MTFKLIIGVKAKKDIQNLDHVTQRRVVKKLKFFLSQPDPLSLAKPLIDSTDGDFRWRVGHYRIVIDVERQTIKVLRVQHRSDAYKK